MKRIGLLSDTHSWIYPGIYKFFRDCDEIWHAGDIGNSGTYDKLNDFKPLRAVFGNIDGQEVRILCPEIQAFSCEGIKVLIKHIGGYPGKYHKGIYELFEKEQPDLFISGHSHILKVMYDEQNDLMHMNPGAAGKYGLHQKVTCLRFTVDGRTIGNLEILEKERTSL